jgi:putative transcriptional regulator
LTGGGRYEVADKVAAGHRGTDRDGCRRQLDRAGHPAAQLGADHLGGLAPCRPGRVLAGRPAPLPAPPPQRGQVSCPAAMKNLVRTLRTQRSLAQGQLAEALGVSRQTINSIENERYVPSLPLALALARYFGVTVEEMFDDQES